MRWLLLTAVLASCGHHGVAPKTDAPACAGCVRDAASGDAASRDAPLGDARAPSAVGAPCSSDQGCAIDGMNSLCIQASPFTGGYCSVRIGECPHPDGPGAPCPTGSECINPGIAQTSGADYCLKLCTQSSDCRVADGYTCCANVAGHAGSFCYPAAICF